jgi:hypothetical protein
MFVARTVFFGTLMLVVKPHIINNASTLPVLPLST